VKSAVLIVALAALVGCGPPNPNDDPAGRADTRQKPTNLTPGIHISGYANVGVIKRF
jgi:hypothetical protein